ncbi:regucalcin-like [Anthonomus grandis grandis]|uniref:regucalcin-like n=1 Tax=Anthonomus grandis grandis TaxID=2921223 RepID=UPI002165A062|nr:regucalcin-like [Anthonomus grandis grandis]XP_050304260.1 regucalcin-like [Anthonomus grandis grandis]
MLEKLISSFLKLLWLQGLLMGSKSNYPSVTQVTEPVQISETPLWDQRVGKLFFVNIHHGQVLAYDPKTQKTELAAEFEGNNLTPIILTKDPNVLLGGLNRSLVKIKLFDKQAKPEVLHTVQNDHPRNRFNDGKADNKGRVWIGTIGYEPLPGESGEVELNVAALFKFTKDHINAPEVMIPKISLGNGLTWNSINTKFYYIDTYTEDVVQYDYDDTTGTISNKKVAFDCKGKGLGRPDGMTIDVDDKLWVALYGGGSVIQVDPTTGSILRRIPIPAAHTTCPVWGGPNFDILYVTTSKRSLTEQERNEQPGAGAVYAVTNLGTKGYPLYEADI